MKIKKTNYMFNTRIVLLLIIFCFGFMIFSVISMKNVHAEENEKFEFNNLYIKEENYQKTMQEVVQNYLNTKKEDGYLNINNDVNLYYEKYIVKDSKATVVLSHGFSESLEKYNEIIYYLLNQGYSVYGIEHRGHGRSGSLGRTDESQINIMNFDDYVSDFKNFLDEIVKPNIGEEKMFLYAHSMGGAIGTKFLEEYPDYFDAAILNAPMLEIDTGNIPEFLAKTISWVYTTFSFGDKYVATHEPYNPEYNLEGSCTSSDSRYKYYYDIESNNKVFQRGGASYNWFRTCINATDKIIQKENASKVEIPVLLFQAEKDVKVKSKGQNIFSQYAKNCTVILCSGAKHEIYREKDSILTPYLNQMFDFYKKNL